MSERAIIGYTVAYGNLSAGLTFIGFYTDISEALDEAARVSDAQIVTVYAS